MITTLLTKTRSSIIHSHNLAIYAKFCCSVVKQLEVIRANTVYVKIFMCIKFCTFLKTKIFVCNKFSVVIFCVIALKCQSISEECVALYKPEVNTTHESSFPAFSLIFHRFWSSLIVQQGAVALRMLSTETCTACIIKKNSISPVIFEHIGS